jgi:hypothetical protein
MRRLEEKYTDLDQCDAYRGTAPTWTNATPVGELRRLGYCNAYILTKFLDFKLRYLYVNYSDLNVTPIYQLL